MAYKLTHHKLIHTPQRNPLRPYYVRLILKRPFSTPLPSLDEPWANSHDPQKCSHVLERTLTVRNSGNRIS
jgi:hypothetical protein